MRFAVWAIMFPMDRISVFTDGGCSGNPGPGAWAFVIINGKSVISYSSGGVLQTTNNIMELTAVINALESCTAMGVSQISVYTDSQYVKNGISSWIGNWKKNGWKTASKSPVKNRELWERLDSLNSGAANTGFEVTWNWVKGHAGIEYNEMCDALVKAEMKKII